MHTPKRNEQGFSAVEGLLIVIILLLIAGAGWLVYSRHHKTAPIKANAKPSATQTAKTPASTDLTYTSTVGGFTVSYPKSWSIEGFTGQNNDTMVPASQIDGTEGSVLLTSSSATSNSFGVWLTVSDSSSATSSTSSALTQIPYAQGSVIKTLPDGSAIWAANRSITTNGHTNPVTCTPFETVSDGAFGVKLTNGKYLDAAMSFCYAAKQTTTYSYDQQAASAELQQATNILSSLKQ